MRSVGARPGWACARRAAEWSDTESVDGCGPPSEAARTHSRGCRRVRREHALQEANGADPTGREGGVGPLLKGRPHARTLAEEPIDKRVLTGRSLRLAGPRRKDAGGHAHVHHDERVALEDAHEVRIPAHADALAEQRERHRIKGAGEFDMAIGVNRPFARQEERKGVDGERLQRPLLDLYEVGPAGAAWCRESGGE